MRVGQEAEKGGCGLGGVCRHTKTAKTVKTVDGLEGRVAIPASVGSMSAVIAAGKKPPKPSNATHPLDHTPPFSAFRVGVSKSGKN